MEYSLQNLKESSNLNLITLKKIIEDLNLIGFEVDEIFEENLKTNNYYKNIRFLIKIPANREDLLTEHLFLDEMNRLFSFQNYQLWKNIKLNYSFFLKQKYHEENNFTSLNIKSEIKDILVFNMELKNFNSFISPLWLKEKIQNFGRVPTGDIRDICELINIEWGNSLSSYTYINDRSDLKVEQLKKEEYFLDDLGKNILIPKNMIVLKDNLNQIKSCLGYLSLIQNFEKDKIIFETIFYDIHKNILDLNVLNTDLSLRYLRKNFLEHFRFSLQRFLTILNVLIRNEDFSIKISKSFFKEEKIEIKRILALRKNLSLKFLNISEFNEDIFIKAGLKLICKTPTTFYFQIPNTRKDLTREIDLIEEYSHFVGYKNFKEITPQKVSSIKSSKNKSYKFIKDFFINLGFNEVIHSSIEEKQKEKKESVLLANPLNNDFFLLRNELSSKIIQTFETNRRLGFINSNFFEIGRIFKNINGNFIEEDRFSAIFTPLFGENESLFGKDFYINKGFLEGFLSFFNFKNISFQPTVGKNSSYHLTRSFLIKTDERIIGIFGELNPFLNTFKNSVYLMELNLGEFKDSNMKGSVFVSKELSKYPSVTKDVSILIDKESNFEIICDFLKSSIKSINKFYVFDIYFNKLQNTKINVGLRFVFKSELNTLTSTEIENNLKEIKDKLIKNFNVEIL